eukprot:4597775-Ditylum_brightwellii.AAC.1
MYWTTVWSWVSMGSSAVVWGGGVGLAEEAQGLYQRVVETVCIVYRVSLANGAAQPLAMGLVYAERGL